MPNHSVCAVFCVELADYLEVDRSALSAELSKMKADGLIDYWKNHFKLLGR